MMDLRNDLQYYGNPEGIGFVDAGISSCSFWKYHQELNADKERLSQESDLNVYFSTYDLEYKNEPSYGADDAHYDSVSEIILGNRFGEYVAKFLDRDSKARNTYRNEIKKSKSYRDDIFVMDILREEMKNDDPRIQRILSE